jgi:hypothetical protein
MADRGKLRGKGHHSKAPPSKGKGKDNPTNARKRKAAELSEEGPGKEGTEGGEGHMGNGSDSDSDGDDSDNEWNNQGEDEWDSPLPCVKDNISNIGVVVPQSVKEKICAGGYIDLMHFIPKGEKDENDDKSLKIVGNRVIQKKI